jgi:2-polyprenyl-3-methyl-5-hydroxy-6-metoxy-1,4-benzoquinol methylase
MRSVLNKVINLFCGNTNEVIKPVDVRKMDRINALDHLIDRYGTNAAYTEHYLGHILDSHKDNLLFDLYLESELGCLNRSRALMASLRREMRNDALFAGKKCLDIGCSAGNSLIAFVENGASQATGVELCEGRFQTALLNISGCADNVKQNIRLIREDIQTLETAEIGQFDIIFCNDVLEHVDDPILLIRQICSLLKKTPGAFAYVNLRNYQHPANVIHEPHYDFPGMVLLPPKLALEYYNSCSRDKSLKYEVYHWMSFHDYRDMFNSCGKQCYFYGSMKPEMSEINHIEKESKRILLEFDAFSSGYNLDPALRKDIHTCINEYLLKLRCRANECRTGGGMKALENFYLDYVIFDICMLVNSE